VIYIYIKPYSFQSDIWALGIILYELCTLSKPFDAESLHLLGNILCDYYYIALKIVRGKFKPITVGNYSLNLKNLISSML
jgi:NIMA (never in mitosis gene a)-related kinase